MARELFTEREQREAVIGYTQGFASTGGILVSGAYYLAVTFSQRFPPFTADTKPGATRRSRPIPRHSPDFCSPFPARVAHLEKEEAGRHLEAPEHSRTLSPVRKTALISCLMMACAYAASFGMLQHFARIIPGSGVANPGPCRAATKSGRVARFAGWGINGPLLMAFLAVRILSRRKLLRLFQVPGLIIIPLVVFLPPCGTRICPVGDFPIGLFNRGAILFLGKLFAVCLSRHLRGTGESFAANIGGRMLGTAAAPLIRGSSRSCPVGPPRQLAYAAGIVGPLAYAIGFIASFWLPEPGQNVAADYD